MQNRIKWFGGWGWVLGLVPGVFATFSGNATFGDVFYVAPSGNHTPPFNSWETAATNLQAALEVSGFGNEIRVADGIYYLSGPLAISQSITVRSEHGAANCTLEGQDMFSTPQISYGARLEGFTLRNPNGFCLEASGALLRNCVFPEFSMATLRAGAILEDCELKANATLYCDSVIFTNCTLGGDNGFDPGVLPAHLNSQPSGGEQGTNTFQSCVLRNLEIDSMGGLDPRLLWHFDQCELQGVVTIGTAPISGSFHGNAFLTLRSTSATNLIVTNFNSIYVSNAQFWNCILGNEGIPDGLPSLRLSSQPYGLEQGTNCLRFCTLRNLEIDSMGGPDPKLLWHFDQCELQGAVTIGAAPISGNFHGTAYLALHSTIATNLIVTNYNPIIYAADVQFWNCTLGGALPPFGMPSVRLCSQPYGLEPGTNCLRFCTLHNVEIDGIGSPDPKWAWLLEPCEILESVTIGAAPLSGHITGSGMLLLQDTALHHATISNLYQLICSGVASISNASISHSSGRGVILRDQAQLSHSRIFANQNGGVFCDGGGVIRNCLLTENQGTEGGGLLLSDGRVESCTIVGNTATTGGGIMSQAGGEILNTIAWGNTAIQGSNWWENGSAITWNHACTAPLPTGSSNLAANPQLTPDYSLSAASPCIQAGQNHPWMIGTLDLAGNPRIINQLVDIGAFEHIYSVGDADGDGMNNTEEIAAGSDPTDAHSFFGLVEPGGSPENLASDEGVVLSWYSATNKTYQIRRAQELLTGFNTLIAQNLPATPPLNTYTDTTAAAQFGAFYRIEVTP